MLYELLEKESSTEEYKEYVAYDGKYHTKNIAPFNAVQFIKLGEKFNLIDVIGKTSTFINAKSLDSERKEAVNGMIIRIQFRASWHGIFRIREDVSFERFHRNLCKLERQDAVERFVNHPLTISMISGFGTGGVIAFLFPISEDFSFSLMLQNFWNSFF